MPTRVLPSPTFEQPGQTAADSDIANIVWQKQNKTVPRKVKLGKPPKVAIRLPAKTINRPAQRNPLRRNVQFAQYPVERPEKAIERLARLFAAKDEVGGALRVLAQAATHNPLNGQDDFYHLLIASEAYRRSKELP